MTYHEMIGELKALVGERPEDFFVGTTAEPVDQKAWHGVQRDWWQIKMPDEEAASEAKAELADLGCDRGWDGNAGVYVYVYRLTRTTRER